MLDSVFIADDESKTIERGINVGISIGFERKSEETGDILDRLRMPMKQSIKTDH